MALSQRRAGILLHPTSLPGRYGVGDLGRAAYRFIDFLVEAHHSLWQVLPLVIPDVTGSPYASSSAFAGNWLLISPDALIDDGLLPSDPRGWSSDNNPVHFRQVERRKLKLLLQAFEHFQHRASQRQRDSFNRFVHEQAYWLREFAMFASLKRLFGRSIPWTRWPRPIRLRRVEALAQWRNRLRDNIRFHEFLQWLFHEQWQALKRYANRRGLQIIGDVPLYVMRDSVDTWADPKNFLLDRLGRPTLVAGVPPDYFSHRGQIWGDPLYHWDHMRSERFAWWLRRFRRSLELYDTVRLDHFRGYVAAWGMRARSRTARHGSWHGVPGRELFQAVLRKLPYARFIAEDLGDITQDVISLRNELGFPGVQVLQFGFEDLGAVHALENLSRRSVVYTGTHDNNTTRGWFTEDATPRERRNVRKILRANAENVAQKFMRAAYASRANTVIVPLQDVINLGSEARLNTPGTKKGNWRWRFDGRMLTSAVARRLRTLVRVTKRR